jgi:hypothetical protein
LGHLVEFRRRHETGVLRHIRIQRAKDMLDELMKE